MKISVCMATYNGVKYIEEQLLSILSQLDKNDEVVVVDDCSKDETIESIKKINDSRIIIIKNDTNKGHVLSFEKAIKNANNDLILLSDQDDIWLPNKIKKIEFYADQSPNILLFTSNFILFDERKEYEYEHKLFKEDSIKNVSNVLNIYFGRAPYFGCGMAFKRELLNIILPFPKYLEAHDHWIAIAANILHQNYHIEEPLLKRRIHSGNVTAKTHRNFLKLIKTRFIQLFSTVELFIRVFKYIKKRKDNV